MTKAIRNIFILVAAIFVLCSMTVLASENTPLEDAFQNAIDNHAETVDVKEFNLTANEVMNAFLAYIGETPRNFFVARSVDCSYSTKTNMAAQLKITYTADANTTAVQLAAFDAEVGKALALVNEAMPAEEKAKVLHDYLIANCSYDTTYTYNTAYDALVNKTGVCQAYTMAYKYLLAKVGIDSSVVKSDAMNHAWNSVNINGVNYHVDVTWDDPIVNGDNGNITPYYDSFLKTDAEISATHYGF